MKYGKYFENLIDLDLTSIEAGVLTVVQCLTRNGKTEVNIYGRNKVAAAKRLAKAGLVSLVSDAVDFGDKPKITVMLK